MTDPFGVLVVIGLIVGILALSGFCVWAARYVSDYRALRRREAEYADAWVRAHRTHQYVERIPARDLSPNRYLTDEPGRPE